MAVKKKRRSVKSKVPAIKLEKEDMTLLKKLGNMSAPRSYSWKSKHFKVKDLAHELAEEFHLAKYLKILKLDKLFNENSTITKTIFAIFMALLFATVTDPVFMTEVRRVIRVNITDPTISTVNYYVSMMLSYLSLKPVFAFIM